MILYQLGCSCGHEFEGWFRDSQSFDRQHQSRLVCCPRCAGTSVSKRLMAPSVRTRRAPEPPRAASPVASPPAAPSTGVPASSAAPSPPVRIPDELRAALHRIRREVEANCDDVGDRFADEAIRIHQGDAPARGIYGNATAADRERLRDEGVETVTLPWLKPADS